MAIYNWVIYACIFFEMNYTFIECFLDAVYCAKHSVIKMDQMWSLCSGSHSLGVKRPWPRFNIQDITQKEVLLS